MRTPNIYEMLQKLDTWEQAKLPVWMARLGLMSAEDQGAAAFFLMVATIPHLPEDKLAHLGPPVLADLSARMGEENKSIKAIQGYARGTPS